MAMYSHSKISAFENCPLKYRYRYVDRVRPEEAFEGIEAFMGKRVHETLERLYKDILIGRGPALAEMLEVYEENWLKNWHSDVRVVHPDYKAEDYRTKGEDCVKKYYERYHPFDSEKTLGLEERIAVTIGGYKIQGYVDRLAEREDGVYEIRDYKTSMSGLPLQENLDSDRQLALYAIAIRERFPDAKDVELVWHYLSFDKELRSKRTEEQLEQLKKETVATIEKIEKDCGEKRFPAKESKLCSWCEYQSMCPNMRHLFKTEKMSVEQFGRDEGVKLVNDYVKLYNDKKQFLGRVDTELEKAKERLIGFAKQHRMENIGGSDYVARVKSEEKLKMPCKGSEEREVLRTVLAEEGLWERFGDVDYYALLSAMRKGEIEDGKKEKIGRLFNKEKSSTVYLKKRG